MNKLFKTNNVFIAAVVFLFLIIGQSNLLACVQWCQEPYCNDTTWAQVNSINGVTISHITKPKDLNNTALLNLDNSSTNSAALYKTALQNSDSKIANISRTLFTSAFPIRGSKIIQIGGTAVDTNGNRYVTGGYTGTINFGGTTITSSNGYDYFIAKYDKDGNPLWIRTARGDTSISDTLAIEGGIALTVDKAGDCYVGGTFVKTMSFLDGSGNSVSTLTDGRNDNKINFEMFVAKYNSSGTLLWTQGGSSGSAGGIDTLGIGLNSVNSIIIDQGYPYIGGRFSGTNFLGKTETTNGKGDFFVASLDKDTGVPDWVSIAGTPDNDVVLSMSADSLGYINVLGVIGKGIVSLPDTSITYNNDYSNSDTFVMSYDVNGQWYFISFIGGGEDIVGNGAATDTLGNIYVTGHFHGTASFVGSNLTLTAKGRYGDGYIVKYDLNGNALWARQFGEIAFAKGNRVVVDANGNSYVVGVFSDTANFGSESSHPVTLISDGLTDMFVSKYDSAGNFLGVKQIKGSGTEGLDLIASTKVPVQSNPVQAVYSNNNGGQVIISGDYNTSLFLDNYTLNAGQNDRNGFVAALDVTSQTLAIKDNPNIPNTFSLGQNYPNPFNPTTTINFVVPTASNTQLDVFNVLGQKVTTLVDGQISAGEHTVHFDASNLASGVYIYRLQAGKYSSVKKLMLMK